MSRTRRLVLKSELAPVRFQHFSTVLTWWRSHRERPRQGHPTLRAEVMTFRSVMSDLDVTSALGLSIALCIL